MNTSKGVTPVVATTLTMLITVAAAGTLYATMQSTQEEAQDSAPDLNLNTDNLYVESCWTEENGDYETSLNIRNTASTDAINNSRLDIIVEGQEKPYTLTPEGLINPQETFTLTFTGLSSADEIADGSQIMFFMGSSEMTYNCYN